MSKNIATVSEKLYFYKKYVKNKKEVYFLVSNEIDTFPICVFETPTAENGFAELKCQLLGGFTFDAKNPHQTKFMKEQGYTIIDNLAYDVQPLFELCDFDVYFGNFKMISKSECANWLCKQMNNKTE